MERYFIILLSVLCLSGCRAKEAEYDVCIYGGTSSGVVAAYSAAQKGLDVVLVEPSEHIGGMTTGGLGYTDIGNKQVVKGIAKQFYRKVGEHYGQLEQWIFEPGVASSIFKEYLSHRRITVLTGHRLSSAEKQGTRLVSVSFLDQNGKEAGISADYFIDCSYEGDLMAASGVSYTVGREANSKYDETYNGVQLLQGHQLPDGIDPYIEPGNPESGLLWGISSESLTPNGSGDRLVQAYNYRICLTDSIANMIPVSRPANYDSTRYELLLRLFEAQPRKRSLKDYFIWSMMPNRKTDINNRGGFSTDMIGMNHDYPEAGYDERAKIIKEHTDYTKGLLYFIGHDTRVPEELRAEMQHWGYPKDEYVDNGNWTPQLYVRESRRMVSDYIATQADCEGRSIPEDGIAMAAYTMDSHNCRRIVINKNGKAMVKNEGNVEIGVGLPYPISYRSIVPSRVECTNLIVPVCLSASHIAYGSIRMEPVFMVLGQVSGLAACLASEAKSDVQDVDYRKINAIIETDPYLDGSVPDIIIDDADGEVNTVGEWKRISRRGGYGGSFLENGSPSESALAVFSTEIREEGIYDIYSYQHSRQGLCNETEFVIHGGGSEQHKILGTSDMKVSGQTSGGWAHIAESRFAKGDTLSVSISGKGGSGPLRADAILIVYKGR